MNEKAAIDRIRIDGVLFVRDKVEQDSWDILEEFARNPMSFVRAFRVDMKSGDFVWISPVQTQIIWAEIEQ